MHSLVSVIVWNVVGCVFGPEVSHFDVFPPQWSLMCCIKSGLYYEDEPLLVKTLKCMNFMNVTLSSSVDPYNVFSDTVCFMKGITCPCGFGLER